MPKMSDTMTEGVIAKWHKKVGDKVSSGDVIAEVETDKATMDLESFQDGTLLYIGAKEGEAVPVDAVIAVMGNEGEDYKAALESSGGEKKPEAPKEEAKNDAKPADPKAAEQPKDNPEPRKLFPRSAARQNQLLYPGRDVLPPPYPAARKYGDRPWRPRALYSGYMKKIQMLKAQRKVSS